MPDKESDLFNCYNRGCGQKFNPETSKKDECRYHPGLPFFHDAYKGWSCCKKKCTDFTEFLNIKGCTVGEHSNEKPPELPKPVVDKDTAADIVEVKPREPLKNSSLKRPTLDTPLLLMKPIIADSLRKQFSDMKLPVNKDSSQNDESIAVGTSCKNGGCGVSYEGPETNEAQCLHHPGCPIFHEGMKYWSCCQKKTTSFDTFLGQVGCTAGSHKWKKEAQPVGTVKCRWDWHQTGSHVVVSVYAKQYDPLQSFVKLNPIRLCVKIVFPAEGNSTFSLDVELRGIIDIGESKVQMTPSKIEVTLRKAEAGSWSHLDFPKPTPPTEASKQVEPVSGNHSDDDDVDLADVEPLPSIGSVNITEVS